MQKKYFKNNLRKNDFHNLLFYNKRLIGYNALLNNYLYISKMKKNYLHFDTLIIHKDFRGKGYSNIFMNFINRVIMLKKKMSVLYCKNNKINFYKKYGWKLPNKKIILNVKIDKKKMIYNFR